ncbi:MAG: hypothetical protein H6621_11345 [Halobacteriovoraceae bacterium]|nr:hypothetical protein [Halobacteriovoraceae bacterium]MCB9095654.1 hypothetical protein [Halobacteriovoraceae bacterium]
MKRTLRENITKLGELLFQAESKPVKATPVVTAIKTWTIVSAQLKEILGPEIHKQWFEPIQAVVLSNDMLILRSPSRSSSLWIIHNYQKLVDLLLSFQDKNLSSFFISDSDLVGHDNSKRHSNS